MRRPSLFGTFLQTALAAAVAVIVSPRSAHAQTCGVALDKTAMNVGANEANWIINVSTDAACAWTATSDSDWLVVKSAVPAAAAGNGYAKVRSITLPVNSGTLRVLPYNTHHGGWGNTTSPNRRTGHFFVNGVVYTVTQGGCGTSCTPLAQPTTQPPPQPVNPNLSKNASFLKLASVETFNSSDANGVKPSDHEPVLAVFKVQ